MSGLIEPGTTAPAFHLADQSATRHRLSDHRGENVVLYFYPKDDTSGCTVEACEFRDAHPEFRKLNATVFGISPDPVKSHQKFADKFDLTFPLLADEKNVDGDPPVSMKYGVWREKSMYGRKYMGIVRTTFIIGRDGQILKRWDQVKAKGHADEVARWLRENGV